jgi:hypothetical protein
MSSLLALVGAFLLVPVCGVILGFVQLGYYRMRVRAGSFRETDIPFFGALLMRGMISLLLLLLIGGILVNITHGPGLTPPGASGPGAPAAH